MDNQIISGAVVVHPGDTLIVALSRMMAMDEASEILNGLTAELAPLGVTAKIAVGVSALAVVRGAPVTPPGAAHPTCVDVTSAHEAHRNQRSYVCGPGCP
jgi:hypothetical protein